jgi:EthD domain
VIKFFGLIPRRPDISELEFHDHYRHPHGTLGYKNRGYVGYVQSHLTTTAVDPCPTSVFEAVAEVWFDNLHTGLGLADDPNYLAFVKDDEPHFVDLTRLKWLYTDEQVLRIPVDPASPPDHASMVWLITTAPTTFKLLQFLGDDDPIDAAEQAALAGRLGALRTTRCGASAHAHPAGDAAFATVRELWWPTEWHFIQGVTADPEAWAALLQVPPGSESLLARAERFT